jgi:hypothetical protein
MPEKRGAVVAARRDASRSRKSSEEIRRNKGTMEEQVLSEGNNIKETYLERENGPSPRIKPFNELVLGSARTLASNFQEDPSILSTLSPELIVAKV